MLLAGDIGGTKTVLALYSLEKGPHHPLQKKSFSSKSYPSLEAIIERFLTEVNEHITYAAFGVAGPVLHDQAQVTNLSWSMSETALSKAFGLNGVHLLNDLKAIATAVPILRPEDVTTIQEGEPAPHGAIAVIAPGTGLGEAFLVWDEGRYYAHPSEGGHTDFAPATPLQLELLEYMWGRAGHISYERVCSGLGIPNLYTFLRDTERYPEPAWLRDQLHAASDPTPIIVNAAQQKETAICVATLELFLDILAREAGNLALKVMSSGGVYLGGGIPPRIIPQIRQSDFLTTFVEKGRFRDLLKKMPVRIIENSQAALIGAAQDGLRMMEQNYRNQE